MDNNRYLFNEKKQSVKKEYFSGANVRVYFGDVWVDQLASIGFEMKEEVAPIYGFNSYKFDKVARGTRLVSGSFTITFTEIGYLQTILDRIASKVDSSSGNLLYKENRDALKTDLNRNTPDRTIENILSMGKDGTYDSYIKSLKNSFWGSKSSSGNTVTLSSMSKEYDTYYYPNADGTNKKNGLKENGFNILIDYSPDANQKDFEDCIKNASKSGSLYQTFRSIIGVHITGESQEISPNGDVLRQTYTFIARDLDGDVTELSMKNNFLHDTEFSSIESSYTVPSVTDNIGGSAGAGIK